MKIEASHKYLDEISLKINFEKYVNYKFTSTYVNLKICSLELFIYLI